MRNTGDDETTDLAAKAGSDSNDWLDRLGETMKLEIEITEDEIKSAIERKVRVAIADQTNAWNSENYIKESVKAHWKAAADSMVSELLGSSEELKKMINKTVEARVKARVSAALKAV